MLELNIPTTLVTSILGTLIALASAGIVWLLNTAYEKHRAEKIALARYERIYAVNLAIHKDNFEEIDKWITSLDRGHRYSFYIGKYYLDEEETYKLKDLEVIQQILETNYKFRRTGADIQNIYQTYWATVTRIDSIQDSVGREDNLKIIHNTTKSTLLQMKLNYEPLKGDMLHAVTLIRVAANVRNHSLFGYIDKLFFSDLFPRVTEKSIAKQRKRLDANIKNKSQCSE